MATEAERAVLEMKAWCPSPFLAMGHRSFCALFLAGRTEAKLRLGETMSLAKHYIICRRHQKHLDSIENEAALRRQHQVFTQERSEAQGQLEKMAEGRAPWWLSGGAGCPAPICSFAGQLRAGSLPCRGDNQAAFRVGGTMCSSWYGLPGRVEYVEEIKLVVR